MPFSSLVRRKRFRVRNTPNKRHALARTVGAGRAVAFRTGALIRGAFNSWRSRALSRRVAPSTARQVLIRRRGGRTRTRTASSNVLQGISQHHDTSKVKVVCYVGKQMKMRTIGRFTYNHSLNKVFIGQEGLQQVNDVFFVGIKGQLQGSVSVVRNDIFSWGRSMYDLNPYAGVTGSAIIAPTGVSGDADSFFLDNINGKLILTNCTNGATDLDVYWYLCKMDSNDGPTASWTNYVSSEGQGQGPNVQAALTTTANATAGRYTPFTSGARPGFSKGFKRLYRCLKKQDIILQGGDTKEINFTIHYKKLIRKKWIQERPSASLANLTVGVMLIQRGAPVAISEAPPTNEMTYAATKIGCIMNYNVVCKAIPVNRMSSQSAFQGLVAGTHAENMILDTDVAGTLVNV